MFEHGDLSHLRNTESGYRFVVLLMAASVNMEYESELQSKYKKLTDQDPPGPDAKRAQWLLNKVDYANVWDFKAVYRHLEELSGFGSDAV